MSENIISEQPYPEIATVEEKIILEKRLPFNPKDKYGPTIDIYFHELITEKNFSQKFFQFLASILLGILFLVTLPLIALAIKLFSREPIFRKTKIPGRRGIIFHQYRYPTEHSNAQKTFPFGNFLKASKLEKLPSIINLWNGEMDLVGPCAYPDELCNRWNKHLSDFYKRFAIKPGYFVVAGPVSDFHDLNQVADSLEKELKYVLNPSFKKDLCHVFGMS